MSSAAVQQQSGPAIQSRQYQQSPHQRDQYYPSQQPANANNSPASTRKPSGRSGGNGASPNTAPSTPSHQQQQQQQTHYSPHASSNSNMTTPRQSTTHASPTSPTAATSTNYTTAGVSVPPRSSSQQRTAAATAAAQGAYSGSRAHPSPKEPSRSQHAPAHSRSATAVGSTPAGSSLPREESKVINRVVLNDPSEDATREQTRAAEAVPAPVGSDITPITGLGLVGSEGVDDGGRGAGRSRQDHSGSRPKRETKFGEYILGQTLGEGEFGKVKMGWKKEGGVQVAIKLIRREVLGSNPTRLPKIYREISILRGLQHPNIVRLHEMVETERHIGIILEYASGGELFDYILNHRYLKDQSARRLFAQLVSGVGYLHKKGIVHRDLKLENLLLDRNKNIIITDFGFANTFNPRDELGDEIEYHLADRDYVKKMKLDQVRDDGTRRGDLMQTSCGSPCYAAPELVVSDSLYTGRKVDVWSCGVILYAMLAGYLPFDDDPANPEGDNINLLYKYIVSTPLTFPEYVTPHARDLLKRILVPDPRKRADLFEVARHSWLADYHHILTFITSSTTTSSDIANATVPSGLWSDPKANNPKEDPYEAPQLARSASVREPSKPHSVVTPVGGLSQKHGGIDHSEAEKQARQRDAKRRTVQVEYVAPQSATARGEVSPSGAAPSGASAAQGGSGRTRTRVDNQGPVEVPTTDGYMSSTNGRSQRVQSGRESLPPPTRPTRENPRSVSDSPYGSAPTSSSVRPTTAGTIGGSSRLPSRGNSYGQPAAATVAATNAQGRFSQPKGKQYVISAPMPQDQFGNVSIERPANQRMPSQNYEQRSSPKESQGARGHKRSNTVGGFGEKIRTSILGSSKGSAEQGQKPQKSYPPTSMAGPISNDSEPRQSTESSRRTSFSFNRKPNNAESGNTRDRSSRRFSLLPVSFSMKSFTGGQKERDPPTSSHSADPRRQSARSRAPSRPQMAFGRGESRSPSRSTTTSTIPVTYADVDRRANRRSMVPSSAPPQQTHFSTQPQQASSYSYDEPPMQQYPTSSEPADSFYNPNESEVSEPQQQQQLPHRHRYPPGFNEQDENNYPRPSGGRTGVLQKNRRFADAYENEHSGSSGSARRVMDFFRRRGKARGGEA
ncbi:Pkinase-domain-containing protein [Saccharata proteae CBS 121410]|uniref:non-specific serine/threonine protein kinase n=1 Tax=Saccharata proteae CBS 121410 TaxID=1314787 RepID=A0A9P4I0Z6_9PEZI|nr:Pkinase-domain-containing protein [Saccharata proteae CBS 121410]